MSGALPRAQLRSFRATAPWSRPLRQIDVRGLSVWALVGALVLYLALDGGGYDLVVRNQVGIAVWWGVLVGAACGVLPAGRLSRPAWVAAALFGAFVAWTAVASTSSLSSERSLDELSRVACYLGVFVLAVAIQQDRESVVRNTVNAIATAVAIVAGAALLSRLRPGTFAAAQQTASFLPGAQGRLAWPLNYWNALAALVALGLPLLFALATSARTVIGQAAAAAAMPMVVLCGYLTFSRGGAFAAAGGMIVYFALTGDRLPKLLTALVTAGGSAALIAGAVHRRAIEDGLTNATARHQGAQLLVAVLLVGAATALLQVGIGLAARHGRRPRWLVVSKARARTLLVAAVVAGVATALAAGAPSRLSNAWRDFKRPTAAVLHQNAIGRFGSTSGNGRYDYWKVAVDASGQHLLHGSGPGTFEFEWLPRAPYESYVQNAHSLYLETLLEDGVIGLVLLVAFIGLLFGATVRLATRSRDGARDRGAAVAAACAAFAISAAVDWIWQVPALPVAFLLLGAATIAPARRTRPAGDRSAVGDKRPSSRSAIAVRAGLVALAVVALAAIAVPLATTNALRESQAAAASGDAAKALSYAQSAARIEPAAGSPQLQSALVLELQRNVPAAVAAARRATADEPLNWAAWLVRSRLEAEAGQPAAALDAFRRARALNPRSPIFS